MSQQRILSAIKVVYSKDYVVDIGNHVFPTSKYIKIKERLLKESVFKESLRFIHPQSASIEEIGLVHKKSYLSKLLDASLTHEEILRMELPFSRALVDAAMLCCGGTILASEIALTDGIGIHIGGGFHHAFPDHGEGFCVLNDIAVAIRSLMVRSMVRRAMVIDCDLHQGNGTASIFGGDKDVYTFSIHQENNYPYHKPKSNMDIALDNRASDKEYLDALQYNIPRIISDFKPDFIVYVAGADPFKNDQVGGLALSKQGLKMRDEFIFKQAYNYCVPIALVLAGGYAYDENDTVDIHYNTIASGLKLFYGKKV